MTIYILAAQKYYINLKCESRGNESLMFVKPRDCVISYSTYDVFVITAVKVDVYEPFFCVCVEQQYSLLQQRHHLCKSH
jgi:hypothetical protein